MITLADAIDNIINDLAKQIYDGGWQDGQIPNDLYFSTAQKLSSAITEGLGSGFNYDDPANGLAAELRANLYQFSGAKSLTEANEMRDKLLDENDKLKSFSSFREDIQATNKLYNEQYLSAEYSNAVAQAQMAVKWQEFEALGEDTWLEYRTAGDDRVRPEHAALDGIVQKIDSAFWNNNYPPNDWGCRCTVVPADQPADAMSEQEANKLGRANVDNPLFENNAGKTSVIYKDDHPYFKSLDGIKELDAVKNYGMKSIAGIMKNADDLPPAAIAKTATDYLIWFNKQVNAEGVFAVTDKQGTSVLFDDKIKAQAEKNFAIATNMDEIVSKPDEMWFKKNEWSYIKYYNDGPYMVVANNGNDIITAHTFSKADSKARSGVLLHKKIKH